MKPKIKVNWGEPPKLSYTIHIDDTPSKTMSNPPELRTQATFPQSITINRPTTTRILRGFPPSVTISPIIPMQPLPPPPRFNLNPPSVAHWDYGGGMAGASGFYTTPTAPPGRLISQQGPVGPTGPVGPIGTTGYGGYYTALDMPYTDDEYYYGYSSAAAVPPAPVEEEYEEEEAQQIKYMINENVLYVNSEDVLKRLNVDDEELYERFMEIMMEISNKAVDLGDSDPNKIKGT